MYLDFSPNWQVKKIFIDFYSEYKERMDAYIGYQTSPLTKGIYMITNMVVKLPIRMYFYNSYKEALLNLKSLLESTEEIIYGYNIIKNNGWKYASPNFQVEFSVIKNLAFIVSGKGHLHIEDLEPVFKIQQSIFDEGWFDNNKLYRITDYSFITGGTRESREKYGKMLTAFNIKNRVTLQSSIVCSASPWIKASI
jgi:hypothetical protein